MNPTATVLVLLSTFLHAGWNLLVRGRGEKMAFLSGMLRLTVFVGFLPAVAA